MMNRIFAFTLVAALFAPAVAIAQVPATVWRGFAEKTEVGTELNVRLREGQRFRAVLVGAEADAMLLQPKTRVPVPVQRVRYEEILSLERRQGGGIGAGKAALIGVAAGVGTFFGIVAIVASTFD